jgi:hypothetical protein
MTSVNGDHCRDWAKCPVPDKCKADRSNPDYLQWVEDKLEGRPVGRAPVWDCAFYNGDDAI